MRHFHMWMKTPLRDYYIRSEYWENVSNRHCRIGKVTLK